MTWAVSQALPSLVAWWACIPVERAGIQSAGSDGPSSSIDLHMYELIVHHQVKGLVLNFYSDLEYVFLLLFFSEEMSSGAFTLQWDRTFTLYNCCLFVYSCEADILLITMCALQYLFDVEKDIVVKTVNSKIFGGHVVFFCFFPAPGSFTFLNPSWLYKKICLLKTDT